MSLDGKLLSRAKLRLEAKKRDHEAAHARRVEEVYFKCPRIRALDTELRRSVIDVIGVALRSDTDPAAAIADIRDNNLYLQSERIQALMAAGFPYDYLDNEYLCKSAEELETIQVDRFWKLVRTAYLNCPFYKELYDREGINPVKLESREDINKLPIIEKKDIGNNCVIGAGSVVTKSIE